MRKLLGEFPGVGSCYLFPAEAVVAAARVVAIRASAAARIGYGVFGVGRQSFAEVPT